MEFSTRWAHLKRLHIHCMHSRAHSLAYKNFIEIYMLTGRIICCRHRYVSSDKTFERILLLTRMVYESRFRDHKVWNILVVFWERFGGFTLLKVWRHLIIHKLQWDLQMSRCSWILKCIRMSEIMLNADILNTSGKLLWMFVARKWICLAWTSTKGDFPKLQNPICVSTLYQLTD